MLPVGNIETVIFIQLLYPWVQLHARMFFTRMDTTSIPMGVMYIHARMFCTLTHTSSIPMGAMYLYMQECSVHSLIQLLCIYMQERSVHWLIQPLYLCV